LADALIAADGAERGALVAKYRDTRGVEYTDALARAIPKLTGEARAQARDALAKRAGRFTPNTLNAMMAERDPELRRAAALAAGDKGRDRLADLAESLVRLTADDDSQVAQAARASLKALSGEDFGPEPGASTADRTRALTAWQNWWTKQKSK
jgi:HEAT repeat protein